MSGRITSTGPGPLAAVAARQALEGQAKVTGGAANTAAQASQQARQVAFDRAHDATRQEPRPGAGLLAGLRRVAHKKRSNDDEGAAEREAHEDEAHEDDGPGTAAALPPGVAPRARAPGIPGVDNLPPRR